MSSGEARHAAYLYAACIWPCVHFPAKCDHAPFDHPELLIPLGHEPIDDDDNGRADDILFLLPEVGADGYDPDSGFCIPNAGDLFAEGMQARIGSEPAPAP